MKIIIIGATHGDELLGTKLYGRLLQKRSPLLEHVDFIVGNPRAHAAGKRYIDVDLNRSYGSGQDDYESRRAREIMHRIVQTKPDLILDMHTTNCHQPNCLIIGNPRSDMTRRFLRASHIDTLLRVQPMGDIATATDNVVGYEISSRNITVKLLDAITEDIQRFIVGSSQSRTKRLFTMTDRIYKKDISEDDAASFVNFELHPLGFVPIMTGNNSYKRQTNYLGFKSSPLEEIEV